MLAIRLGYYSTDYQVGWAIDSIMDYNEDIYPIFINYIQKILEQAGDDEIHGKKGKKWVKKYWIPQIDFIEKRLRSHQMTFVAGTTRPTCADFKCF